MEHVMVGDRSSYAQIYFRTRLAKKEYELISNNTTKEYVLELFNARNQKWRVPMLLCTTLHGSKPVPMLYFRQYALSLVVPTQFLSTNESNQCMSHLFEMAKESGLQRTDLFQSYNGNFDPIKITESCCKFQNLIGAGKSSSDFVMHRFNFPLLSQKQYDVDF